MDKQTKEKEREGGRERKGGKKGVRKEEDG